MARPAVCWQCRRLIGMAKICPHCHMKQKMGISRFYAQGRINLWRAFRYVKALLLFGTMGTRLIVVVSGAFVLQMLLAGALVLARDGSIWQALSSLVKALLNGHGSVNGLLVAMGASTQAMFTQGDWWGPLTATYLHGGIVHLGFNLLALSMLAPLIQRLTSPWVFALIYQISGITGFILSALNQTHYNPPFGIPSVGASGALFGLIGCGMVVAYKRGYGWTDPLFRMFLSWFLFAMVFGLVIPAVDNAAHLGGWIGGVVCAWLWLWERGERASSPQSEKIIKTVAISLFVLTTVGFLMSITKYTPYLIGS
ncbi:MAG: rhomboid family intramembrane serine protease [Proteobacteria bacterium]|nr:rhomboid family intramembrane serine protease [Pseudomonadota bacterium]